MQFADETLALDTPGWSLFIYYHSQWVQQRSCANPLVALAQKWRKQKLLLSFSILSLCKKSHIAGRALVYSCANKNQDPCLPPSANMLPELGPTSSGPGTASSRGLPTRTSPLYSSKDKKYPGSTKTISHPRLISSWCVFVCHFSQSCWVIFDLRWNCL